MISEDMKAHSDVEGRSGMIAAYRRLLKGGYTKPSQDWRSQPTSPFGTQKPLESVQGQSGVIYQIS
ncbi:hypothetical protein EVB99_020 [Rhizobium phage RHph_N3_19]|nr:hypothetical protein EVB99_020 [Rhizobium phage RHph_N3_19]